MTELQNLFFNRGLAIRDAAVAKSLQRELARQNHQIELIASENMVSAAVLEVQGSIATNKYAEGYPERRYYGGCEELDTVEQLAIDRACTLFNCQFANVQPHSGSQANQAVFLALLRPGDTIMGMSLAAGGHLTHGAAPTLSGKWFKSISYGVRQSDMLIDFEHAERLAKEYRPKLIIAGASAYSRIIDFGRFREIANSVNAYLLVDMAHVAGLVAAGLHPSPFPHAHVVTTTTHKTLRGPRGGLILTSEEELAKKINSAVFPGIQGGPLMHVIAAKAVALGEALQEDFRTYSRQVIKNARALSSTLKQRGFDIVSGDTDNHLMLIDLRSKRLTGKTAEQLLERAHLTCNKNGIPFDPEKPAITSGIRLGTPACTTRGFIEDDFAQVGNLIADVLENPMDNNAEIFKARALAICKKYPIYSAFN